MANKTCHQWDYWTRQTSKSNNTITTKIDVNILKKEHSITKEMESDKTV